MKKKEVAAKMQTFSKGSKRQIPKNTVEGDSGQKFLPEDRFSKKDVKNEKKGRTEKHGKIPKSNWEI